MFFLLHTYLVYIVFLFMSLFCVASSMLPSSSSSWNHWWNSLMSVGACSVLSKSFLVPAFFVKNPGVRSDCSSLMIQIISRSGFICMCFFPLMIIIVIIVIVVWVFISFCF